MAMWQTKLVLKHSEGVVEVDGVQIARGIFQGDTLSPLLFVLAINPVSFLLNKCDLAYRIDDVYFSHMIYMDDIKTFAGSSKGANEMARIICEFSSSIGMKFGLDKCRVLNVVRGKYKMCGDISLHNGDVIKEMAEGDVYKYLGVTEAVGIKHSEMKKTIVDKYRKKLKTVLKTELNAKNIMIAINEYALPVLTYTFGIINWTEDEIKGVDVRTRKDLNMSKMFEVRSDVDRLYMPRCMGGRGLVSAWDSFRCTSMRLSYYLAGEKSPQMIKCCELDAKCLFSITRKAEKLLACMVIETPKNMGDKPLLKQAQIVGQKTKEALHKERLEKFKAKPQHGVFFRHLDGNCIAKKLSLSWLEKCHLSPKSEAYIIAAQELALFTRWHEKNILKKDVSDTCRACKKVPETMSHILAGCDTLAKKEYFDRHNAVARYVHHSICDKLGVPIVKKWHLHKPPEVFMDSRYEIIWDMVLPTDRPCGANRPDIVVREKEKKRLI